MHQVRLIPTMSHYFFLLMIAGVMLNFSGIVTVSVAATDAELQIVRFGPGVHDVDQIILEKPHALLEGSGRGITILRVPGGIIANAPEPVIRDLTIVGNGTGVGLTLRDVWTARVDDVEIESYSTGVVVELTTDGVKSAGGKTKWGWPGALTPGHWGSRVTLNEFRGVEITGDGDAFVLRNRYLDYKKPRDGSFFSATTIWGGHIKVEGHSLVIGDGVSDTKLFGTFIDAGKSDVIVMDNGAMRLSLIGVTIDLSKQKQKRTGARKLVAGSRRTANSIEIHATNLKKGEIVVRPN